MTMWGEGGTLKGRYWKLSNGYWAARNHQGKQCTFRLQVEAQRFAEKRTLSEAYNPFSLYDDPKVDVATKEIQSAINDAANQVKSKKLDLEKAAGMVYKVVKKWTKLGADDTESLEGITDAFEKATGQSLENRIDSY